MKAVIALAALVVVGLLIYGGVEAAKPGDEELKPTFFTLLDGVEIPATTTIRNLPYVDVEGFSEFRIFISWVDGTQTSGRIDVKIQQSRDGLTDIANWRSLASFDTGRSLLNSRDFVFGIPETPPGNLPPLEPPYLYLRPIVENTSLETQTVSVFLYAVP